MKQVHLVSTAIYLPENDKETLADFQEKFDILYYNFGISMTLNVHVIYHHFVDYFELSGETLRNKSTEFIESTYSKFRIHKEVHGYKVTKVL